MTAMKIQAAKQFLGRPEPTTTETSWPRSKRGDGPGAIGSQTGRRDGQEVTKQGSTKPDKSISRPLAAGVAADTAVEAEVQPHQNSTLLDSRPASLNRFERCSKSVPKSSALSVSHCRGICGAVAAGSRGRSRASRSGIEGSRGSRKPVVPLPASGKIS